MGLMDPLMRIAGCFSKKIRLGSRGRKDIFAKMSSEISLGDRIVWFHVASLGEFEQGRPVMELMRERHPELKILITFFSPSGYEIRKNYDGADYIFYLPSDTKSHVARFMSIVRPEAAIFIKYEFWLNYLDALKQAGVPTLLVSSIFRKEQIFFKPHGGIFREALDAFTHIFTQNNDSVELLRSIGYDRTTAVGDTRFDRVNAIVSAARSLPIVERFVGYSDADYQGAIIAGSTWPQDEKLLVELINANPESKFIIAPHEIEPARIESLRTQISASSLRYTQLSETDEVAGAQVLFVDTIGILSSVYRYGRAAYIGGGFGVGIHNTLEAATFALPLCFGPNYRRFQEACQLIERGGAVSIENYEQLNSWFVEVVGDATRWGAASAACKEYVAENVGASEAVMDLYDSNSY